MSHLPLAIDTLITEKDVAAAKKAILKAKATLPTRNASAPTFPPIAVPHRLSEDQNYLFQASEVYYECMEWTNLYQSINRLQQALPKAPHALESRKRLAHCMLASAPYFSTAYRDTAANLAVDPADGDLYLGMALIKLSEFYLVDCGHLIELAALCPTYHPHVMSLAREKLEWTQSSAFPFVFSIHNNVRSPASVQWIKDAFPEMKHAWSEVEAAINEWMNTSNLDRYRLARYWLKAPHLAPFLAGNNLSIPLHLQAESKLFSLPNEVLAVFATLRFSNIIDVDLQESMPRLATTCRDAEVRLDSSKAWAHYALTEIGIPKEKVYASEDFQASH